MQKRLTYSAFGNLQPHEQTSAFFSHESNQTQHRNKPAGPALTMQAAFWNDWRSAFANFQDRLPSN